MTLFTAAMHSPRQCLVTGGTGFIGRYVVRALLARGDHVRLLCRDEDMARALFGEHIPIQSGTLFRPGDLQGIDTVIHLAGVYRFGRRSTKLMEQVNVAGTEAILAAAWGVRVERFVHVSSSGILSNDHAPITERDFPAHVSTRLPYRHSKWQAEQAALRWAAKGLPVTMASPTSPLGAEDVTPTPTGRMIVDFLAGKVPFAGPTVINFIDVAELAAGILAVTERGRVGERYILGAHDLWHAEFLRLLAENTGRSAPTVTLPWWVVGLGGVIGDLFGSDRLCWETAVHCRKRQPFDLRKAKEELGWSARVPVEESSRAAIAWYELDSQAQRVTVSAVG